MATPTRTSPITISTNIQPVTSTSWATRAERSSLPCLSSQLFQISEFCPLRITREDPNVWKSQYSIATPLRRVDRHSREIIVYFNDRMIHGTYLEEELKSLSGMKISW
ncbi:hypothetical protein O181_029945 [Austropuccinia psidii MF-1]|uniref:Uncharacterized protein n=1 Tax=Austropuccinia psidii MF-1 TaxID=1389203 RepID=A0A9Q3CVC1_9BASI|nr:hypothetical protein [Austropuccinia psidii MF-1]